MGLLRHAWPGTRVEIGAWRHVLGATAISFLRQEIEIGASSLALHVEKLKLKRSAGLAL